METLRSEHQRRSMDNERRALTELHRFMGSEADLDADIKGLSILSEHPALYQEFAKLGCVASLVSLLSHENTDIAIDAIEIIEELTDEDVSAEQDQWDAIVDAMLEVDLLDLLFQNISRLDESIDSDRAGVFHILGILENLSSRPSIASQIGSNSAPIPWLVSRAKQAEKAVSQNRQYATEVLAILLQSSSTNRTKFLNLDGTDAFLQLLAPYRRRDPEKGTEEEEFFENLFDCITCCVDDPGGKDKFLKAEGVELCLIMLKEGKMSRTRALRLLDHACGGPTGAACAEHFVEAGGLSRVFTIFMKKVCQQETHSPQFPTHRDQKQRSQTQPKADQRRNPPAARPLPNSPPPLSLFVPPPPPPHIHAPRSPRPGEIRRRQLRQTLPRHLLPTRLRLPPNAHQHHHSQRIRNPGPRSERGDERRMAKQEIRCGSFRTAELRCDLGLGCGVG